MNSQEKGGAGGGGVWGEKWCEPLSSLQQPGVSVVEKGEERRVVVVRHSL